MASNILALSEAMLDTTACLAAATEGTDGMGIFTAGMWTLGRLSTATGTLGTWTFGIGMFTLGTGMCTFGKGITGMGIWTGPGMRTGAGLRALTRTKTRGSGRGATVEAYDIDSHVIKKWFDAFKAKT